jgi:hypothetical protein
MIVWLEIVFRHKTSGRVVKWIRRTQNFLPGMNISKPGQTPPIIASVHNIRRNTKGPGVESIPVLLHENFLGVFLSVESCCTRMIVFLPLCAMGEEADVDLFLCISMILFC